MTAIMYTPSIVSTIHNRTLMSPTTHFVQPNSASSRTEVSSYWSTNGIRITKFTTDDSSVLYIPTVITYGSPLAIVKYLYSSLSAPVSTSESQTYKRLINWLVVLYNVYTGSVYLANLTKIYRIVDNIEADMHQNIQSKAFVEPSR